jgi:hypothetical protein
MTDLPAYATGLFVMLALACLTANHFEQERWAVVRSAGAILANWIAGAVYVATTDNHTPWHFSIFIDALAALAVMYHPAGRVQGAIGLFYFLQIAGHIAFGFRRVLGMEADAIFYYDAITYVAWAQLAAMGVWCGGIWGRSLVHRVRNRRDASNRHASARHIRRRE